MTLLEVFPDELTYKICELCDTKTLLNISKTCKYIYNLCFDIIDTRRKDHSDFSRILRFLEGCRERDLFLILGFKKHHTNPKANLLLEKEGNNFLEMARSMIILPNHKLIGSEEHLFSLLSHIGYKLPEIDAIMLEEAITFENYKKNKKEEFKKLKPSIPIKLARTPSSRPELTLKSPSIPDDY